MLLPVGTGEMAYSRDTYTRIRAESLSPDDRIQLRWASLGQASGYHKVSDDLWGHSHAGSRGLTMKQRLQGKRCHLQSAAASRFVLWDSGSSRQGQQESDPS